MDDEVIIWGIYFSLLIFVYENFMYVVVVYICFQKNMNKQWYNILVLDLKLFMMVSNIDRNG